MTGICEMKNIVYIFPSRRGRKNFQISLIILFLIFLTGASFYLRLYNFKNKKAHLATIDENVYYVLGLQLKKNLSNYSVSDYAETLKTQGYAIPAYFKEPLFKHPPLFPLFLAGALTALGEKGTSAITIVITFGVLLILLTYFFGKLIYDRKTGLLAALFLSLDPINIICAQKVWMETTLAFFTCLTIALFAYALKKEKNSFFLFSGIASGLATLTKYPGILGTAVILIYALVKRRDLFKVKTFWAGLIMPLIFLLPWMFWNYSVYGFNFFPRQASIHDFLPAYPNVRLILLFFFFDGIDFRNWNPITK